MVLQDQKQEFDVSDLPGQVKSFSMELTGKAFRLLSKDLYADPITALVRELIVNGRDSHVAAGKPDLPVKVHLPWTLEPFFSVTDQGVGLSEADLAIYTTYFRSTKTTTNEQTGALGLGSKSPFAYTTTFDVITTKDGITRSMTCFLREDSSPQLTIWSAEETGEPNGVMVRVPVADKGDFQLFHKALQEFDFFQAVRPEVVGAEWRPIRITPTMTGSNWELHRISNWKRHFNKNSFVVQGGVAYDISRDTDMTGLVVTVPIGQLDFQINRENLQYTDRTKENLKLVLEQVRAEIEAEKKKEFGEFFFMKNGFNMQDQDLLDTLKLKMPESLTDPATGTIYKIKNHGLRLPVATSGFKAYTVDFEFLYKEDPTTKKKVLNTDHAKKVSMALPSTSTSYRQTLKDLGVDDFVIPLPVNNKAKLKNVFRDYRWVAFERDKDEGEIAYRNRIKSYLEIVVLKLLDADIKNNGHARTNFMLLALSYEDKNLSLLKTIGIPAVSVKTVEAFVKREAKAKQKKAIMNPMVVVASYKKTADTFKPGKSETAPHSFKLSYEKERDLTPLREAIKTVTLYIPYNSPSKTHVHFGPELDQIMPKSSFTYLLEAWLGLHPTFLLNHEIEFLSLPRNVWDRKYFRDLKLTSLVDIILKETPPLLLDVAPQVMEEVRDEKKRRLFRTFLQRASYMVNLYGALKEKLPDFRTCSEMEDLYALAGKSKNNRDLFDLTDQRLGVNKKLIKASKADQALSQFGSSTFVSALRQLSIYAPTKEILDASNEYSAIDESDDTDPTIDHYVQWEAKHRFMLNSVNAYHYEGQNLDRLAYIFHLFRLEEEDVLRRDPNSIFL